MNGFIKATAAGLCLGAGLTAMVGCTHYREIVDPCWPQRYDAEARLTTRELFGAQAHNGHVLDQTVWNYHFETDPKTGGPSDKLNAAGMEHLRYVARRQPAPDPSLYLQTALDVPAGTMAPDKVAQARTELDTKRMAAVQKFMASVMTGRSHACTFDVAVLDVAEPGIAAIPIAGTLKNPVIKGAIPDLQNNYKGRMPGPDGVTMTTTGGGSQ